ncbi:MAG: hypothetical protein QMB63_07905 [Clostridiaceae bacterium]
MNHETEKRIELLENAAAKTTFLIILFLIALGAAGYNLFLVLMDARDGVLERFYNIGPFTTPFMGVRLNQAHLTVLIAGFMVLIPLVILISLLIKNSYMKRNNIPGILTYLLIILVSIGATLIALSILQKFLKGMTNYSQISLTPLRIGIMTASLIATVVSILAMIDIGRASKLPDYVPKARVKSNYVDPDDYVEERDDEKYVQDEKGPEFNDTADFTDKVMASSQTSVFEPLPVNENGNIVVPAKVAVDTKPAEPEWEDLSLDQDPDFEPMETEKPVEVTPTIVPEIPTEVAAPIVPEKPVTIMETKTVKKYLELPGEDKLIVITREFLGERLVSEKTEIVDKKSIQ